MDHPLVTLSFSYQTAILLKLSLNIMLLVVLFDA